MAIILDKTWHVILYQHCEFAFWQYCVNIIRKFFANVKQINTIYLQYWHLIVNFSNIKPIYLTDWHSIRNISDAKSIYLQYWHLIKNISNVNTILNQYWHYIRNTIDLVITSTAKTRIRLKWAVCTLRMVCHLNYRQPGRLCPTPRIKTKSVINKIF